MIENRASFHSELANCILDPIKRQVGEAGAILVKSLILSEIKKSFKIDLPAGTNLSDAIESAYRVASRHDF
jgi:hypothetical protein